MDDILTSHNDFNKLKAITAGVEQILKVGGFHLKPWTFSRQNAKEKCKEEEDNDNKTIILPNQMPDEDSKALGFGTRQASCQGRH